MYEEIEKNFENAMNKEDSACGSEETFSPAPPETGRKHEEQKDISGWKDDVIKNCYLWIEGIHQMPVVPEKEEEPDLYSFYEQLCVLRNEFRKNSRRSHETFSEFGEHLEEFQHALDALTQRLDMLDRDEEGTKTPARQRIFLHMIEIYERFRRFGEKLKEMDILPQSVDRPHEPGFMDRIKLIFADKKISRDNISNSVVEGFSMTLSHFEDFLASEGVSRIDTTGAFFDPSIMMAAGAVEGDDALADRVYEEIEGGYLYGENVLKLAKVTVTKGKKG